MDYKSFFIKSYGCQMNVYDSNKIKSLLENKGLDFLAVPFHRNLMSKVRGHIGNTFYFYFCAKNIFHESQKSYIWTRNRSDRA